MDRPVGRRAAWRLPRCPRPPHAVRASPRQVAAFGELERAISKEDVVTVKRLSRDPRLACHPALEKRKAEIDTLIATSDLIARLLESLRNGKAEAFLAEADPNLLATHAKVFLPYKEQITAWFEDRLRQRDICAELILNS